MWFDWRRFDRRKRLWGLAIALVIALLLVDRSSLLIAPCGSGGGGYSDQKNANDDNCAIREGIVVAGIEWLSDRAPETWTALATLAVALFTWTLWRSSEKLWRITRISTIATRRAANAARKSADAIQIVERPYIFIWGMVSHAPMISYGPLHGGFPQQTIQEKAAFIYSVSNRGKLTAVIENVLIACGYERNGLYPPLVSIGDHYLLRVPLISSDKDVENIPFEITWRELDRMNLNPSPEFRDDLIFRVVIEYRGPFTKNHETSQCWRYRKSVNGWMEVPHYTYSRQRPDRSDA